MHENHDVNRCARRKDSMSRRPWPPAAVAREVRHIYPHNRASEDANMSARSLFCLHGQPASYAACRRRLFAERLSGRLASNLSSNTLVGDSSGDTLVGGKSDSKGQSTRLRTICNGDIDLFLLRNPDNPEQDILTAEVDFQKLRADRNVQTGNLYLHTIAD